MSKNKGQYGFFDLESQLEKIYQLDDFLPKLNSLINRETASLDANSACCFSCRKR